MTTLEFNNKYQKLSRMLNAFAYKLTQDTERAKDLYQETTFRALTYRDKFRTGTNFKAWVFTIMKNLFINDYRKRVRANVIMDSTDNDYYIDSGKNVVINQGDSNIMMDELTEILDELDDGYRVPFLMHYEGYKYQEIAEHFDLPIGTVKSRIFLARKELKQQIEKKYAHKFSFN